MDDQIIPLKPQHHDEILQVWAEAVRATHDFMTEDEITAFLPHLRRTDIPVDDFYGIFKQGQLAGFIGIIGNKVELLFIRPAFQGQGMGRQFLDFAVNKKGIYALDVYEENKRAYDFYTRLGFQVTGRLEHDSLGFAHPVLKMHLIVPLTSRDHEEIIRVWNESVKATHLFISAAERAYYETCIRKNGLSSCCFYGVKQYGRLKGFMAIAADKIEMLFLHYRIKILK